MCFPFIPCTLTILNIIFTDDMNASPGAPAAKRARGAEESDAAQARTATLPQRQSATKTGGIVELTETFMKLVANKSIVRIRLPVPVPDVVPPNSQDGSVPLISPDAIDAAVKYHSHVFDYLYVKDDNTSFRFAGQSRYMLIRPAYAEIYENMMSLNRHISSEHAIVNACDCTSGMHKGQQITGCQGIGKSFFIYYFIYRLINSDPASGVYVYNMFGEACKANNLLASPSKVTDVSKRWLIVDSVAHGEIQWLQES